jgi:hypothetical protein
MWGLWKGIFEGYFWEKSLIIGKIYFFNYVLNETSFIIHYFSVIYT